MPEPYDTINAINTGPEHWWRFSVASGSVTDEGQATARNLNALAGGSGSFNGTYRFDANPFGDGFGIRFNGQGGFQATSTGLSTARGTMFVVFRSVGNPGTAQFQFGFRAGNDIDYCHLSAHTDGSILYVIQDGSSDDEFFNGSSGNNDSAVHSMAVIPSASTTVEPDLFVDGSSISLAAHVEDNVPDNYWWDSFTEIINVGMRGAILDFEATNLVAYEMLLFDTVLSAQQISDVHDILTTAFVAPLVKHQRRRGRRVFNAAAL